jgi:hypothetical protein
MLRILWALKSSLLRVRKPWKIPKVEIPKTEQFLFNGKFWFVLLGNIEE